MAAEIVLKFVKFQIYSLFLILGVVSLNCAALSSSRMLCMLNTSFCRESRHAWANCSSL